MKSKTRALTGVLACTLAASLLAGCASGAPGGAGAPAKIQLSIPDPLTSSVGVSAQHFADEVKKTSNGSVIVTVTFFMYVFVRGLLALVVSIGPLMDASHATSNGRIRPEGRLRLDRLPATAKPAFFPCREVAAFLARQKSRLPPSSAALRA